MIRKLASLAALLSLLVVSAWAYDSSSVRREITTTATASHGCAPWDGRTIDLKVTIGTSSIVSLQIWNDGLAKLTPGSDLALDTTGDMNGDGSLTVCEEALPCSYPGGRLHVDSYTEGESFSGQVFWNMTDGTGREFSAPFSAVWDHAQQICG